VEPWDPTWAASFEAVRAQLERACADVPGHSVEHVGSTAVPHLAAKAVLDITVVVPPGHVDEAIAAVERAGYRHEGERGIPDRHAFTAPPHGPTRHVYVAVEGSLAVRNQLAVRDVLRQDPELRERYGQLKHSLAARDLASMDEYVAAKTPLLQEILRASGRFTDDELQAIAVVNRPPDGDDQRPSQR
jgi:GrpB-like predicted nucleotidyltransferase (UPF0157 family)